MLHINRYYEDDKSILLYMCRFNGSFLYQGKEPGDLVSQDFAFADKQLRYALTETESVRNSLGKTPEELPSPRNIQSDGSLRLVRARDWCSGFFPGELWYMYEYTKDDFWKKKGGVSN